MQKQRQAEVKISAGTTKTVSKITCW